MRRRGMFRKPVDVAIVQAPGDKSSVRQVRQDSDTAHRPADRILHPVQCHMCKNREYAETAHSSHSTAQYSAR